VKYILDKSAVHVCKYD